MQIPSYSSRRQDRGNDAMTPMIDVVFLLLIFFVCAAAGQVKEAVLPTEMSSTGSVTSEAPVDRDPWIVEVWLKLTTDTDGVTSVDMNGRDYQPVGAVEGPLRSLAELSPENPVILQISSNVPMRDVIRVYDLCEAAGFKSINFAARADALQSQSLAE